MRHRLLVAAVLALPGVAQEPEVAAQVELTQDEVDAAIQRGVAFLLEEQASNGGLKASGRSARPGASALAVYALIKSGVDPGHEAIRRALTSLAYQEITTTYDVACVIMALAAATELEERDWLEELTRELLGWQRRHGWGYPVGNDLSNTQYAALGLRAAALAGIEVPDRAWLELAKAVGGFEGASGGYTYRRGSGRPTGSMTSAGIGTLAICDAMLTRSKALTRRQRKGFEKRKNEGLEWLARNFTVSANPGAGGWLYYYLYGLERVGGLTGERAFGGHDWYREGARYLVDQQDERGYWGGRTSVYQTAFALLFLSRATSTPVTGRGSRRYGVQSERAQVRVAAAGDTPLTLWLTGIEASGLEWPGEEGRGPRVLRVEYRMGEHAIGSVRGDRSRPSGSERYVYRHNFREPGRYHLHAQVEILEPRKDDAQGRMMPAEVRVLKSPRFEVHIREVQPAWAFENAADAGENLVLGSGVRASASSTASMQDLSFAPSFAVDGRLRRPWLAAADDERPTLNLTFARPPRANTIVVSHARTTPHSPSYFGRALEVEVLVNGKDRHRLRMHSDERRKGRLVLDAPVVIRELELVIPWKAPGERHGGVGFAEVELQRR
ncbi:MAG: hypothetical protein GY711_26465 [bacterium]|nr:hypothetical protein [bacterium]